VVGLVFGVFCFVFFCCFSRFSPLFLPSSPLFLFPPAFGLLGFTCFDCREYRFFLGFPFFLPTCSSFLLIGPLTLRFRGVLSNSSFSSFYFSSPLFFFGGGAPSGLRGGKEEREGGFSPSFSSFFSSFVLVPLFFSCVSHLYTQYSHHTPIHTYTYMRPSPIASFLVERGREDWLRPKLPIFAFLSVGEEGDRRQT